MIVIKLNCIFISTSSYITELQQNGECSCLGITFH